MHRSRRRWLGAAAAGAGLGLGAGMLAWPDEGVFNPCLPADNQRWLAHPLVRHALAGLDPPALWDAHVHLFAAGSEGHADGPWPVALMQLQRRMLANAACLQGETNDAVQARDAFLRPLLERVSGMPPGVRLVLLAMDAVLGQLDFKPSLSATKAGLYRLVFSDRGAAVCNDLVTVV